MKIYYEHMKWKIFYCSILFMGISVVSFAQEQFEKKISIFFYKESFLNAMVKLTKTQSNMGFAYDQIKVDKSLPVTINLQNVTFDEAIDTILSTQNIYKDYWVLDYGKNKHKELNLREERINAPRYVERNKNKGRYYHIGDKLPDSTYTLSNYPVDEIKLSDFKKRLIILDLWNVNCGGCITAMPNLEHLQEIFNENIQIILVTRDGKGPVEALKKRSPIVRDTKLPSITGENILGSLFDYNQVPDQVWLDENGTIIYVTKSPIATEKQIKNFLLGKRLNLPELKDTSITSTYDSPITVALQPIQKGNFGIASYLSPHREVKFSYGLNSGGFSDTSTIKSITKLRFDLFSLYRIAYFGENAERSPLVRILTNKVYAEKFKVDSLTWNNTYDYELITKRKEITAQQFYGLMQLQLDCYFGLHSSKVKSKIPCYILERTGNIKRLRATGIPSDPVLNNNHLMAENAELTDVLNIININRLGRLSPLIDETGFDPHMLINLSIDVNFENKLIAIRKSLIQYGITIRKEVRDLDCILLK